MVGGARSGTDAAVVGVRGPLFRAHGRACTARRGRSRGRVADARQPTPAPLLLVARRPGLGRHRDGVPRMTRASITLVLLLAAPVVAEACPICFRDPESPMTAGAIAGVATLLSITAGVLGGVGVLIRRIV